MKNLIRSLLFIACLKLQAVFYPPVDLSGPLPNQPSAVTVSLNDSGKALATWEYFDGTNYNIPYSLLQNGIWTTNYIVSPSANQIYMGNSQINNAGNALVGWNQFDPETFDQAIYVSYFNGTSWGSPVELYTSFVLADVPPVIAFNDLGQGIATWITELEVYANVTANGTSWLNTPVLIAPIMARTSSVAISNNQTALVIFSKFFPEELYYTTYDFQTQQWSGVYPLPPTTPGNSQTNQQIAMNDDGTAVAVWLENDQIIASATYSDGSWSSSTVVANLAPNNVYFDPSVSLNSSGDAFAVWQIVGSDNLIQYAQYSGGSWGAANTFSNVYFSSNSSVVALNDSGNALSAWNQSYAVNMFAVNASTYNGSSWLPPYETVVLSSDKSPDTANAPPPNMFTPGIPPSAAINNAGDMVVTWYEYNGTSYFPQASTNILPASTSISGSQQNNQYPFQTQYFNRIQWAPSPSTNTVGYRVYRDGTLLATLSGLQYSDNSIAIHQTYTYAIAAIDIHGNESTTISVTISP